MIEIDIEQLKGELESFEEGFYLKEIKRMTDHSGKKKDIMGYTREKFKFVVVTDNTGMSYLEGANEKIPIPRDAKILKTEADSIIIRKRDGMIFLNTR